MADEWLFTENGSNYSVKVSGNFSTNNGWAVHRAVMEGLGIARLPLYGIEAELEDRRLQAVFIRETKSDRVIKAYYPRTDRLPAKTRVFLNFLRKRLTLKNLNGT